MFKRGQVTVFIIIGIVMVFLFAGVVYIVNTTTEEMISTEGEPVIAEVPLEFAPIQSYTENCLGITAKRGLTILGQQGGYIDAELLGEYLENKPTDSVGINMEPVKVPYWHYNAEPDKSTKVVFASWKPELKGNDPFSIEMQLSRYIKENLGNCLRNYEAFDEQGFEVEQGEVNVEVLIDDEKIGFWLKMPLEVKKASSSKDLNQFYVKYPLKLKHMYEVAQKITEAEQHFGFLESQAMNLIAVFSGPDIEKMPPTTATTFDLAPMVFWNEIEAKEKFRRLLTSYVPMLRFLGSDNFYDFIYPDSELSGLYQATQDQMVINLAGAEDLEVSFDYFNWPIYFKTNSANGLIKPMHFFVKYWTLTMGHQSYETNYDFSYPVLVALKDTKAFGGEGYNFVFGLEANVRNNKVVEDGDEKEVFPMTASRLACEPNQWDAGELRTIVVDSFTGEPIELVRIGFTIPEKDECDIGFTDSEGELESKFPAVYGGIANFIKEDYLTNFYPIDTYNMVDRKGLIGYAVADHAEQVVEMHKFKKINVSIKKKNLEKCLVPLVCKYTGSVSAIGLALGMTVPDKDISCEKGERQCFFSSKEGLFLDEPVVKLEANGSLSKYNEYYFTNTAKSLSEKELGVIILRRVGEFNSAVKGEEYTVNIELEGDSRQEIELVPGIYEVMGNIRLNEKMLVPAEARSISYDILTWENEETFKFNDTKMEKMVTGMMTWNTPKTYLEITPEDLYTAKEIEFYLLSQNLIDVPEKTKGKSKECAAISCLPNGKCLFQTCKDQEIEINARVVEDLQVLSSMVEVSQMTKVREALEPRFK